MSNRMLSALVAGAFTAAIGSLTVTSATAQMSKGDMEKMMKENIMTLLSLIVEEKKMLITKRKE